MQKVEVTTKEAAPGLYPLPPWLRAASVGDLNFAHHPLVVRVAAPDAVLPLTISLRQHRYDLEDPSWDDGANHFEEALCWVGRTPNHLDHPHEAANFEQGL